AQYVGERTLDIANAARAAADGVEVLPLQIGRKRRVRPRRISASERLPGEIIVGDVEVAGQPLDPLTQNSADPQGRIRSQRLVLRRRDAEAVEGRGLFQDPADERLVEDRREA